MSRSKAEKIHVLLNEKNWPFHGAGRSGDAPLWVEMWYEVSAPGAGAGDKSLHHGYFSDRELAEMYAVGKGQYAGDAPVYPLLVVTDGAVAFRLDVSKGEIKCLPKEKAEENAREQVAKLPKGMTPPAKALLVKPLTGEKVPK